MRQKSVQPPDSIESSAGQIELLRARVERQVRKPAIVVITSAKQGDGKSLTAFLLAKSLAKAGRRTALVGTPHGSSNEDAFISSHDFRDLLVRVQLPKEFHSTEASAEYLSLLRAAYEFTIIDSGLLLTDTVTMALAENADGLLLAVRLGRAPSDDDDLTIQLIEQFDCPIIGLIAALHSAIDDFSVRRDELVGGIPRVPFGTLRDQRGSGTAFRLFETIDPVPFRSS